VKLLLDENLSPRLVELLQSDFPGSGHVHELGLGEKDDMAVWQYAKDHGFTLVTKDADFNELSLLKGYPPRIIWIRRGNCSTKEIKGLLLANVVAIHALDTQPEAAVLILY
jgi:predicted nuclease of predicted toxin-antitoxin system